MDSLRQRQQRQNAVDAVVSAQIAELVKHGLFGHIRRKHGRANIDTGGTAKLDKAGFIGNVIALIAHAHECKAGGDAPRSQRFEHGGGFLIERLGHGRAIEELGFHHSTSMIFAKLRAAMGLYCANSWSHSVFIASA